MTSASTHGHPVRLMPGIGRTEAWNALQELYTLAANVQSHSGSVAHHRQVYLEWVDAASARLRPLIARADIERLLFTRRYEHLLSWVVTHVEDPTLRMKRWDPWHVLVVPDTNVLLHHDDNFDAIDWHATANADPHERLLVVLPILVVDQVDNAKTGKNETRSRARDVTRSIGQLLVDHPKSIDRWIPLHEAKEGRDRVGLAVVFDPPGHVRMPETDDEIIERSVAVQELASGEVRMLTHDAGAAGRAARAGLQVALLPMPESSPPGRRGARASGRGDGA